MVAGPAQQRLRGAATAEMTHLPANVEVEGNQHSDERAGSVRRSMSAG